MFVIVCEYSGSRHSNPLHLHPDIEVVGPFDDYEAAVNYEAGHRYEGCERHSLVPLVTAP
jgi:hypothetical protein